MKNEWPTRENDLLVASEIINKYIDFNDGEPVGLLEMIFRQQQLLEVKLPDWLVELSEHFTSLYGNEHGNYVTKRILSRCFLGDHTLH